MSRTTWGCEVCSRRLRAGPEAGGRPCPTCGQGTLALSKGPDEPLAEQILPLLVHNKAAVEKIVGGLWSAWSPAPPWGRAEAVAQGLVLVWWPEWLVDVTVSGSLIAEYGVETADEALVDELVAGKWVQARRPSVSISWRGLGGQLREPLRLHNLVLPACREHEAWLRRFPPDPKLPFAPPSPEGLGWVRLPDESFADQPERVATRAREAVVAALQAQLGHPHVRGLYLEGEPSDLHPTLRLRPVWSYPYEDGEGGRRIVWVDGATGRLGGQRLTDARFDRRALQAAGSLAVAVLAGTPALLLALMALTAWLVRPQDLQPILVLELIAGLLGYFTVAVPVLAAGFAMGLLAMYRRNDRDTQALLVPPALAGSR